MTLVPRPSRFRSLTPVFNEPAASAVPLLGGHSKPPNPYTRPRDKKGTLRLPVKINFLGTIWPSKDQTSPEERQYRVGRNQQNLSDAVLILSQSATGRELLRVMTLGGYKIVFDDQRSDEYKAYGLCDLTNKRICLRSTNNVYELALVLAHEAVHACQSINADLIPDDTYRIEQGIRLSFAIEADAHAQQVQVALELAYGDARRSSEQVLFPEALMTMRHSHPALVTAAETYVKTRADLASGIGIAAAFEAFYSNAYLRGYYEDLHVAWCYKQAQRIFEHNPSLFGRFRAEAGSDWIIDNIAWQGQSYLRQHLPSLKLDDIRHSGLTEQTITNINIFHEAYMAREKKPSLRKYDIKTDKPKTPSKNRKPPFSPHS